MQLIKTQLQQLRPELPINIVQLPEGHSMNDMWMNYGVDGILQLLQPAKEQKTQSTLKVHNDYKISYKGSTGTFYVIGNLPMDLGNLRVPLQIVEHDTAKKHRLKIDLFDFVNVENQCRELSEKQGFDSNQLKADLVQFTDLLETHRESLFEAETP
jgi:hypothetical protein